MMVLLWMITLDPGEANRLGLAMACLKRFNVRIACGSNTSHSIIGKSVGSLILFLNDF